MRKEANGGVSDDEGDVEVDEDDEAGWDDWEVESDDSTDSGGWEEVSSNGEDLEISDSDDEVPVKAKKRKLESLMEEDEDEDDSKSVVSAVTTELSQTTKKLSLLAQQKVRPPLSSYARLTYADPHTRRLCPPQ